MPEKERVSLAIEPELLARFDDFIENLAGNRSEVMRDLIRARLNDEEWSSLRGKEAVATVTIVYDHHQRKLAERLLDVGHEHHDSIVTSLHVHLDHDSCLEVVVLRGNPKVLRTIADQLISMKGVKHGKVVMTHAGV
jgi:CopG family transcriptional regulator, nickel-responsive regulator